ncbi:MAG: diacylglycerol/lipid kinase family protein [Anderseniella sp.]
MKSPPVGKRILIIYNPSAGGGAEAHLAAVKTALEERRCDVTLLATGSASQLSTLYRDFVASDWDVVAIAGGDGTLMEAINGLRQGSPVLALIATGTANVVALDLGLVVGANALADIIVAGRTKQLCAGQVNNKLFTFTAGVGFDAAVVARVRPRIKKWTGKLAFALAAMGTLVAYRYPVYRLTIDDKVYSGVGAIILNGRYYAGKHIVSADNDLGNGSLCVVILNRPGRIAALSYSLAMLLDRLPSRSDVTVLKQVRSIEIAGDDATPVQIDGEIACHLPVRTTADAARFDILA